MRRLLLLALLSLLPAETALGDSESPGAGNLLGTLETRPSWNAGAHEAYALHSALMGFCPKPEVELVYKQYLHQGFGADPHVVLDNGYAQATVRNLWESADGRTGLHYRARGYTPFSAQKWNHGLRTIVRQYLIVKYQWSDTVRFTTMWEPGLHFYSRGGYDLGRHGHGEANPYFENRFYAGVVFTPFRDWSLYLPLKLSGLRYHDWKAASRNNDRWRYRLWVNPLLLWQASEHAAVGVAYASEDLLHSDDPFGKGIIQLVLRANL